MKKIGLLALLMTGILATASAQTISIMGTVKTGDGDALYLAFVQDKQYKAGAYTDSLGTFTLSVYPNSQLHISCFGFRDTLIQIDGRSSFSIVLVPKVNIIATRTSNADKSNGDDIGKATLRDQVMQDGAYKSFQVLRDANTNIMPPSLVGNPKPPAGYLSATQLSALEAKGVMPPGVGANLGSPANATVGPDMAQGAIFPVFTHKEATQGSRYLFDNWMHGYVINASDSTIQSPALFFNYDKIGGSLLLTKDKHEAIEVYKENVKSFTLFDAQNQPYTFVMVPEIDKSHYVQLIASGNNYKIYKSIKTKFVEANYVSDGVASSGNNFDSFEDNGAYYLLDVKTNRLQPLSLKKKSLKLVFANQVDKLNKFMADNNGDIDDTYLASLGDYMNK